MTGSLRPPVSTYRLQLHTGFTFADAAVVVPYLAELGVTDCYLSPPFVAKPGSTHGYDVGNHNEVNPELGGPDGFDRLTAVLAAHGMGLVLDFVPNHMGIDPRSNEWWRDVLENGPSSPFAAFFDIDWDPLKPELKDRILLPILGEPYGEALESGRIQLAFDAGGLQVHYFEHRLPVNPRRAPVVYEHDFLALSSALGDDHPAVREFLSILTSLKNLPAYTEREPGRMVERQREKEVARSRLARLVDSTEAVRRHVAAAVSAFNGTPGDASSFDRLHGLLEQQPYRLASWRTAADEINYRRFFDVNDLAGVRVEDRAVFDHIHQLVLALIGSGKVSGLRLDHVDGLSDPASYLARLQDATRHARAAASDADDVYVVVEKILSSGETLPGDWRTAGTTGYTFLNDVNGLFLDTRNARSLLRTAVTLTRRGDTWPDVAYQSKRLIVATAMTSEFQVLANAINRISEGRRHSRDFTLGAIRRALREVVACFPAYRTYVSPRGIGPVDRAIVGAAIAAARARNPAMEPSIFDFLATVLLPGSARPDSGEGGPEAAHTDPRLDVAMRFQQYTPPVQAKGIEDTAFYRYNVLLSLNEVGGDPGRFGRSVTEFHQAAIERLAIRPLEMNATSTHDTKRGEDARARLNVLSELPADWRGAVSAWMRLNRGLRSIVEGEPAPDRNDEYHFYQALLAVWPPELEHDPMPDEAPSALVRRLTGYMAKAIREAKVHTSWVNPNGAYERAVASFVERALSGVHAGRFLQAFVPFARRVAAFGMVNALGQVVLKLVSPGVPDFYQGTETWHFTLVDPDNRQTVDYAARRAALQSLAPLSLVGDVDRPVERPDVATRDSVARLLEGWPDGRLKLWVTTAGLRVRRARPDLFRRGEYIAAAAEGRHRKHVVACCRTDGTDAVVAIVPRLAVSLRQTSDRWPIGSDIWQDTRIAVPSRWRGAAFRNLLTGTTIVPAAGPDAWIPVGAALSALPVALLWATQMRPPGRSPGPAPRL